MAAAAALVLAVSAFLFWQKSAGRVAEDELMALAVIQEPEQINYASLLESSEPLKEDLQPLFDQALEAFRTHRFNDAKHHLEKIRHKHPHHSAALYLLAYSYYKLNQPQKAFELCSLSESIRPHSYERCMFLVNLALKTRHYDRARLEISTLYHEAPDAPEVKRLYHAIMRLTENRKDSKASLKLLAAGCVYIYYARFSNEISIQAHNSGAGIYGCTGNYQIFVF